MSQSYPLALPYVRLTVAGTVRTSELQSRTLSVTQILGAQVDTCSFQLKAAEIWRNVAGSKPTQGQGVLVEHRTGSDGTWEKVFGGTITRVREVRIGFATVAWACECVDYSSFLSRVLVNKTYPEATVSSVVKSVVSEYAPFVSVSGVDVTETRVKTVTYANVYPETVVQQLADICGYDWYVSPDKVLYFFDPESVNRASANTLTDTSQNFHNLSIEPQLDQVRNRVTAEGGFSLSDEIVEQYDADGLYHPFPLNHQQVIADLSQTAVSGTISRFMEVNGVRQTVGLKGSIDQAAIPTGFLLDAQNGLVEYSTDTAIVPRGARVLFRYQWQIPISVIREDLESQATVAALEGTDYQSVIDADLPVHWWRLAEANGSTAFGNFGTPGGLPYQGQAVAPFGYDYRVHGPLTGDQGRAIRFFGGGYISTASGTVVSPGAYSLEAWVNADPATTGGVLSYWNNKLNSGAVAGRGAGILVSGGLYHWRHQNISISSNIPPTGGGKFDHVVAAWNGLDFLFCVNKQVCPVGVQTVSFDSPTTSGIEIANMNYDYGPLRLRGTVAEPAVYNYALSPERIAAHYDAGRYGGVRETIIQDRFGSLEQARNVADLQLAKYASVLTDVQFASYVPGWQVGDTVTINVTASATGRTYSDTAKIQTVEWNWIGAERVLYRIGCVSARHNWIDYLKSLQRRPDTANGQVASISVTRGLDGLVHVCGGSLTAALETPPYRVAPDWTAGTTPYIKASFWQVAGDWS